MVPASKTKEDIYKDYPRQLEIHLASGQYSNANLVVALLYRIMRDSVPTGVVEGYVQDILKEEDEIDGGEVCYTNGWLAQYAANIIERLEAASESSN